MEYTLYQLPKNKDNIIRIKQMVTILYSTVYSTYFLLLFPSLIKKYTYEHT